MLATHLTLEWQITKMREREREREREIERERERERERAAYLVLAFLEDKRESIYGSEQL